MASSAATARSDLVILSAPSTWEQWFEETRSAVPDQLWKYFNPDDNAEAIEPDTPVRPVDEPPPPGPEPPQQRKDRIAGNKERLDIYYRDYNIYKEEARHWEKYNDVKARLRERIQSTVAPQKKSTLRSIYSVRKWLTDLKASTAMPLGTIQANIQHKYHKLMGTALLDWPSRGPTTWLTKWEEIISQSIRYDEPLRTWLRDVCLVWERVPELSNYFSTVQTSIDELDTDKYTPASISAMIQRRWEHKKQGSTLRVANKPRTTRSAFPTQAVTLNGEEAPDTSVTPESTEATAETPKQPKRSTKRKQRKSQNNQRGRRTDSNEESSNQSTNRSRSPKSRTANDRSHDPCVACGGTSHTFSRCYLVLGQERDWLTDEARDAFKNNMKAASFKKRVDDYRKALQTVQGAADQ